LFGPRFPLRGLSPSRAPRQAKEKTPNPRESFCLGLLPSRDQTQLRLFSGRSGLLCKGQRRRSVDQKKNIVLSALVPSFFVMQIAIDSADILRFNRTSCCRLAFEWRFRVSSSMEWKCRNNIFKSHWQVWHMTPARLAAGGWMLPAGWGNLCSE
jgi:hypothetical protein